MGCGRSRINDLPLPYVIKQLSECDIPDDRNQAMDYIDQIDALLADEKERVINMKQLKKLDGVKVIIRQTKKLTDGKN